MAGPAGGQVASEVGDALAWLARGPRPMPGGVATRIARPESIHLAGPAGSGFSPQRPSLRWRRGRAVVRRAGRLAAALVKHGKFLRHGAGAASGLDVDHAAR